MTRLVRVPLDIASVAVTVTAVLVIIACVLLVLGFIFFAQRAERYTTGVPPVQFYRELDVALLDDYSNVFGVAHNSGDSLGTTREALEHGADVIEIDVVYSGGKLRAAHDSPLPVIGSRLFRGPALEDTWTLLHSAEVVKLDLKEDSGAYLRELVAFLESHPGPRVMVASKDRATLEFMAVHFPQGVRLMSIANPVRFKQFQDDPGLVNLVDGVTLQHTLVNEDIGRWLEDAGLLTVAWTVNDATRMNELISYGVDAITTDNLAIMALLGGQSRSEALLIPTRAR